MQQSLREKISDKEKIALFQQILHKYLFFKNKIETTTIQVTVQEPLEKQKINEKKLTYNKKQVIRKS